MTAPTLLKRYEPRGAAAQIFRERGKEVLLCGPAGTGKTRANLEKLHAMALLNGACPKNCMKKHEHQARGFRGLIVRKTLVSLTSTAVVTYKEHVANEALEAGIVTFYGGSRDEPPQYRYSNGSKIMLAGMDNPTKVMSSEFDVILVVEATELTVEDWEKCTSRLRNGRTSFQQIIADCNPEAPTHWLKQRCDRGTTKMLYARHTDNPILFERDGTPTARGREYLATLANLTGVRRLRLEGGIWAAAEGVIYEDWDPGLHLTDKKKLPFEWRRIWSLDFGYTNPFVWQQWAIDSDGRAWLEKELYITQTLVEDAVKMIAAEVTINAEREQFQQANPLATNADVMRSVRWKYPRPDWVLADHDAEDRATFERHTGIRTIAAIKEVSPGIQAMQKRMRVAGDGKPRIFVLRDALVNRDQSLVDRSLPMGFAQEVGGYVWKPKPQTSTLSADKPIPDEPLKLNDHSMDAGRYVIAQLDLRAVPGVRRL